MATIVVRRATGEKFVALGAGYGLWTRIPAEGEEKRDLFGPWAAENKPTEEHGAAVVVLANIDGALQIEELRELSVESVDGKPLRALLGESGPYR